MIPFHLKEIKIIKIKFAHFKKQTIEGKRVSIYF